MRVASIGECMVELNEQPDGSLRRGFGGDTLNTAIYLARLGVSVDYLTALGDDGWSDEMVVAWDREGVGTGQVHRVQGRLPGLYIIQTDAFGERRFLYWRDSAAARLLFDYLDVDALRRFDVVYLSGVSFSIFDGTAREMLFEMLSASKQRGGRVVFDTNFRPRNWPDRAIAQQVYQRAFTLADIILASAEDLSLLFGTDGEMRILRQSERKEIVLKMKQPGSRAVWDGNDVAVGTEPVLRVVDTTAAGDSFAAAYLAARLRGEDPVSAARCGHRLAGIVVGHPGAIAPREAMAGFTVGVVR